MNEWLDSQTDSSFRHSVVNDVILLISQAVCFHLILIIFEPTSRRKWYANKRPKETDGPKEEDLVKEQEIIDKLVDQYEKSKFVPKRNAVIVKGLSAKYKKKEILRNVNFRVSILVL